MALYGPFYAGKNKPVGAKPQNKKAATRKQVSKAKGSLVQTNSKGKKWLRQYRITNAERKANVQAKIQKALSKK
jgi:hypothetical protein